MKKLGIDYGLKRIGVAISDDKGRVAFPLKTVSPQEIFEYINEISEKEKIETIVIGESKDFKGVDNAVMEEIHVFEKKLKEGGFNVAFEPEYLTSVQAARMVPKDHLDASAATIILQSFLDKEGKAE